MAPELDLGCGDFEARADSPFFGSVTSIVARFAAGIRHGPTATRIS